MVRLKSRREVLLPHSQKNLNEKDDVNMCGINGLVFLKDVNRDAHMMAKVRFIFDELMVETMDRGEHATGLASFKRDGSYEFHKKNINADKMATTDEKYREIVANFDGENTSVVIAHTRYMTKGTATNMNNNHPFDVGNIVGLHNGSAKNDDSLFTQYKDKFTRVGEVDSEIVFQLINYYNDKDITLKGLRSALEDTKLRGLFALAFVHKNNPNKLHLIKQEKPMYVAYWKEAGIVIFNSIDDYIEKAFNKLERLGHNFGLKNTKQTVEVRKVTDDRYFTVNADATTVEDAFSEEVRFYIESSSYTYYSTGTKSSGTTTTKTSTTGKKEKVTATDSKGLVLTGEIDTATGEVIIYSNDDIVTGDDLSSADDGSGLIEEFSCFECNDAITEEEISASYNRDNPKDESICFNCYTSIMNEYMNETIGEDTTKDIVDCDGHKVG